jgi:spore maturation protein CgeB
MKTIKKVLVIICDTAWTKAHLARGWRMTGAEVTVVHFGSTMGRGWDQPGRAEHLRRNEEWRKTASELAANGGLDLVFMVALDDVLENRTLEHFKSLGAKLVLFQTDMFAQWYRVMRIIRFMDLVCYGSKDHLEFYRRRGIPLFNFGFAAIPPTAEEWSVPPIEYHGVLFTGSPWPYRQMVLHKLVDNNVPLRIYGHSWDRKGSWPATPGKWRKTLHDIRWYLLPRLREEGPELLLQFAQRALSGRKPAVQSGKFPPGIIQGKYGDNEFVALVRGAAINLGFTQMMADVTKEYPRMIRLRDFEVPIAGGFYLTQNCPELSEYFEVGKEVAVWETAQDVVERCRYYLERPEERARIAEAGRERALNNHTWMNRFSAMAKELGMRLPCDEPAAQ